MTANQRRSAAQWGKPARSTTPSFDIEASERDLPLKVQMRRLFWTMGVSTSLDVKLRAYVSGDKRGPGWQEFTDLDVLGVGFSPAGQPHLMLADCKTSQKRAVERMFWIRGVADFFRADAAFMVRSHPVPAAARALSGRVNVGVLDPDDYNALVGTYPTDLDFTGPLGCLFDLESVRRQCELTVGLAKKLDSLVDFVRFDYWIYEPYRNLTQVVAHLADAVQALDPSDPKHLALFFETAWLYSLALAQAAHHIRTSRLAEVPTALAAYVAGGELSLREKAQLAGLLQQVGIAVDTRSAVLPPYIGLLAELTTRVLTRPSEQAEMLRYAEYLVTATAIGEKATVGVAFGAQVRPVAAKLLGDVCGFLVSAAGLRPEFRALARDRLVVDLTGGMPGVDDPLRQAPRPSTDAQPSLPMDGV